MIAHNLLRAAGTLAGGDAAVARGATLRRDLVNVPARFAAPARRADAAPTSPLALANRMENSVGRRHRLPDRATARRLTRQASPVQPPPGPT